MLSKLASIAKREDLQLVTGLTERQMQLLFFLLFSPEEEYSYGKLKKQIKYELKISFNDKTLSRSLSKLEEKQVITWIRAEKFQRNESSTIRLNEVGSGEKLGVQKQAREMLREYESVKRKAKSMSEKDITSELIEIAKKQAGASLFLRLRHAQGTFDEEQTGVGLMLSQVFFDSIQDLYIDEIKGRDMKSMRNVLDYFLNSGIET
jgi:hypothetical protein